MKITMLGTGHAFVTECYNTCFVIENEKRYFMVDGGGGNTVLRQLRRAGFNWKDMREIFVTHAHIDHLLGIVWMTRLICQLMVSGKYEGDANIYAPGEVISVLHDMTDKLLLKKETRFIDNGLYFIAVSDGEERTVNDHKVTFFDINSTKTKQFGFCMELDKGGKMTCCGDEPYNPCEEKYAKNSTWLLHEAFCLYSQADIFAPYEKRHSTVKDACETAERLNVQNLLLYHTEDRNLAMRKELYTAEGKHYFRGNIWVPDDLETITL